MTQSRLPSASGNGLSFDRSETVLWPAQIVMNVVLNRASETVASSSLRQASRGQQPPAKGPFSGPPQRPIMFVMFGSGLGFAGLFRFSALPAWKRGRCLFGDHSCDRFGLCDAAIEWFLRWLLAVHDRSKSHCKSEPHRRENLARPPARFESNSDTRSVNQIASQASPKTTSETRFALSGSARLAAR